MILNEKKKKLTKKKKKERKKVREISIIPKTDSNK